MRQPLRRPLHHGGQTWTFRQLCRLGRGGCAALVALPQAIVGLAADAPALALAAVACSAADRALWPLEPNAPAERRRDCRLGGAAVAWLDALPAAAAPPAVTRAFPPPSPPTGRPWSSAPAAAKGAPRPSYSPTPTSTPRRPPPTGACP